MPRKCQTCTLNQGRQIQLVQICQQSLHFNRSSYSHQILQDDQAKCSDVSLNYTQWRDSHNRQFWNVLIFTQKPTKKIFFAGLHITTRQWIRMVDPSQLNDGGVSRAHNFYTSSSYGSVAWWNSAKFDGVINHRQAVNSTGWHYAPYIQLRSVVTVTECSQLCWGPLSYCFYCFLSFLLLLLSY